MQRILAYLAVFILTIHFTPFYHINSLFLSKYWGDEIISLAFFLSALLAVIFLGFTPKIISKIGNLRLINILIVLEFIALIIQSFSTNKFILFGTFVSTAVFIPLLYLCLDIILENASRNKTTGNTRGTYLTLANLAFVIGPLMASLLIGQGDFYKVFLIGAIIILLLLLITNFGFRKVYDEPDYKNLNFSKSISDVLKNRNLRNTTLCTLFLNIFYAWMVVFVPLFLIKTINLPLNSIPLIMGLALIAFVIFQKPAGILADKAIGEKEILIIGFLILGLSSISIPFIKSSAILVWALVLFITRVGASLVEVMAETHLYKQITSQDSGVIGVYNMTKSAGYIIGPLLAFPMLAFFPGYTSFFFAMAILAILGILAASRIRDSK